MKLRVLRTVDCWMFCWYWNVIVPCPEIGIRRIYRSWWRSADVSVSAKMRMRARMRYRY